MRRDDHLFGNSSKFALESLERAAIRHSLRVRRDGAWLVVNEQVGVRFHSGGWSFGPTGYYQKMLVKFRHRRKDADNTVYKRWTAKGKSWMDVLNGDVEHRVMQWLRAQLRKHAQSKSTE